MRGGIPGFEVLVSWDYPAWLVLKVESCAAGSYEVRQVRKEAAVNGLSPGAIGLLGQSQLAEKSRKNGAETGCTTRKSYVWDTIIRGEVAAKSLQNPSQKETGSALPG